MILFDQSDWTGTLDLGFDRDITFTTWAEKPCQANFNLRSPTHISKRDRITGQRERSSVIIRASNYSPLFCGGYRLLQDAMQDKRLGFAS
jgi:hypothetical protein